MMESMCILMAPTKEDPSSMANSKDMAFIAQLMDNSNMKATGPMTSLMVRESKDILTAPPMRALLLMGSRKQTMLFTSGNLAKSMLDPSEKAIWRVEEDSKLKEVKAYTKANSKEILKLGKVQ